MESKSKFVVGVSCGRLRFREPIISIAADEIETLIKELRAVQESSYMQQNKAQCVRPLTLKTSTSTSQ